MLPFNLNKCINDVNERLKKKKKIRPVSKEDRKCFHQVMHKTQVREADLGQGCFRRSCLPRNKEYESRSKRSSALCKAPGAERRRVGCTLSKGSGRVTLQLLTIFVSSALLFFQCVCNLHLQQVQPGGRGVQLRWILRAGGAAQGCYSPRAPQRPDTCLWGP